jgi:hypothetical protein
MANAKKKTGAAKCACPFCEVETEAAAPPFCQACGVAIRFCMKCKAAAPRDAKVCPTCGGQLAGG